VKHQFFSGSANIRRERKKRMNLWLVRIFSILKDELKRARTTVEERKDREKR
jgi:hypothetical protein